MHIKLSTHPSVLFAYSHNYIEVILNVINETKKNLWFEADIHLSDRISLNPTETLNKGRIRLGILKPKEYIKRSVKVYANSYTNPNTYPLHIILYAYDKNAVIYKRIEKDMSVRCEIKRKAVI